jgi:hypothetical protein
MTSPNPSAIADKDIPASSLPTLPPLPQQKQHNFPLPSWPKSGAQHTSFVPARVKEDSTPVHPTITFGSNTPQPANAIPLLSLFTKEDIDHIIENSHMIKVFIEENKTALSDEEISGLKKAMYDLIMTGNIIHILAKGAATPYSLSNCYLSWMKSGGNALIFHVFSALTKTSTGKLVKVTLLVDKGAPRANSYRFDSSEKRYVTTAETKSAQLGLPFLSIHDVGSSFNPATNRSKRPLIVYNAVLMSARDFDINYYLNEYEFRDEITQQSIDRITHTALDGYKKLLSNLSVDADMSTYNLTGDHFDHQIDNVSVSLLLF